LDAVGGLRIVTEIPVRLVEDHERRVIAERGEEPLERPAPDNGRRRVVRRAEEDGLGARGDARQDVVEVGVVALERASDGRGAREARLDVVGLEGRVRHQDLVVGLEGRARDEPQDLVAAVAGDDPAGRNTQPPPDRFAERRRAAVRVEVGARGFTAQRFDDHRRRAQGALVGREP